MKNLVGGILMVLLFAACNTSYNQGSNSVNSEAFPETESDTVRIANEEADYEIIIIDPGFSNWMRGRVRPRGFYSQRFLENRNYQYVLEWNNRVLQPDLYDPMLYFQQIDYNPQIDYGYEVNYLLYYYFIYFQMNYKQQLTAIVPRI